jgi:hypothetical protein
MLMAVCDTLTDKAAVGLDKMVYMRAQQSTVSSALEGYVG